MGGLEGEGREVDGGQLYIFPEINSAIQMIAQ